MIRVCCTFGTWQLITLVAALQHVANQGGATARNGGDERCEDYLVVYETGGVPEEFQRTLHRLAEAVWPWKRIISAYDLLTNERKLGQRQFDGILQDLRERVGVAPDQVDEIWTCWLGRPAEKKVFAAFPNARIVLYEDGLISYLPLKYAKRLAPVESPTLWSGIQSAWRRWQHRVAPVTRFRLGRFDVDPRDRERVSGVYLQLSPDLDPPSLLSGAPLHRVPYCELRTALDRAAPAVPSLDTASGTASDAPPLLVLGQAMSRSGVMTRAEELAFYQSVVRSALECGYRVLWKEHPRISEPFFEELKRFAESLGDGGDCANRVEMLSLPRAYPVELVADRLGLAGCVSGTSAAPFYLNRLYGIPCYAFADDLLVRMKELGKAADVFMGSIVRDAFPPLSTLPPADKARPTAPSFSGRRTASK